jgi:photosystem II stability/assembly factor-like uncharacterized protein
LNSTMYQMLRKFAGLLFCVGLSVLPLRGATWFPLGPYGGDARSLTADPHDSHHLYLGTATGWVYESHDGGQSWSRLAHIDGRSDLVIDHILTDPGNARRLMVGAWFPDHTGGGIFVSEDGGKNWYPQAEMHGQSVFSLARSASDPNELVAGTLRGVFRSEDDGTHWQQISPPASAEIHEVESVAIDPADPQVIYVGTWHLPWKTSDGGAHWSSIKEGLIEDSDVFSIIIDPARPNIVYASACSGIYKSVDAGAEFKGGVRLNRTQGLPSTARRTRKLAQDPQHSETVYAGTTEGLYRTLDGGGHWDRMTAPDVIVNDVWVDPANDSHILLATDRYGVLSSDDMAATFQPSNTGFSSRLVDAYAADPSNQAVVYVGVVNDKQAGGVFQSRDGGVKWQQISAGLGGRDAFSLGVTSYGTLIAGTAHGIFRWSDGGWSDSSGLLAAKATISPPERSKSHRRPVVERRVAAPREVAGRLDAAVYALVPESTSVFAATSQGLLRGDADGQVWQPVSSLAMEDTRYLAGRRSVVLVAGLKQIAVSTNGGETWKPLGMPEGLTQVGAVAVDDAGHLWVGGLQGLFASDDGGASWMRAPNLSVTAVDSLYFDAVGDRILLTSSDSVFVYAVHLPDGKVNYWNTGWKLRFARPVGDHLIAASLFDGVVVQPKMVDTGVEDVKASLARQ